MELLQAGAGAIDGEHYVTSTPETVQWGWLPNRTSTPVLRVAPGATVTIDTVSHEGILDDQGRDPIAFFARYGIDAGSVLHDARDIAASALEHTMFVDGPHVVTGPVAIDGAEPGDVLRVDVLSLVPRAPYGCLSNRHGCGALPDELPATPPIEAGADALHPERFHTVCHFVAVDDTGARPVGVLPFGSGRAARFPIQPFMGITTVAPATDAPVHSRPPGRHGGNLDVNELGAGSSLYLPVAVPGALFAVGDPHYAQGDGEVCLTALEAPLRATYRFTVLRGAEARRAAGLLREPFGETDTHWIPMGLDRDLNEAMRNAVRAALDFLTGRFEMDRATAYAYLSAAADFEISQVVDDVKGVHCLIRKHDFAEA